MNSLYASFLFTMVSICSVSNVLGADVPLALFITRTSLPRNSYELAYRAVVHAKNVLLREYNPGKQFNRCYCCNVSCENCNAVIAGLHTKLAPLDAFNTDYIARRAAADGSPHIIVSLVRNAQMNDPAALSAYISARKTYKRELAAARDDGTPFCADEHSDIDALPDSSLENRSGNAFSSSTLERTRHIMTFLEKVSPDVAHVAELEAFGLMQLSVSDRLA